MRPSALRQSDAVPISGRGRSIASREMYNATNRFVAIASGQVASKIQAPVASSGYAAPRQAVTSLWSANFVGR
jgi:hypothetical protein